MFFQGKGCRCRESVTDFTKRAAAVRLTRPRGCDESEQQRQLLLLTFLLWLQAAIGSGGKLLLKLVDATSRVDVLQLPGVEGMAFITNVDLQLGTHAAGREGVAATTGYGRFLVLRVDAVFHGGGSGFLGV